MNEVVKCEDLIDLDMFLECQSEVDGNFQSFHDPSYQDYRAEAQTHYELRNECIKKAALAYSKKQGELAKVYADQVSRLDCLVMNNLNFQTSAS